MRFGHLVTLLIVVALVGFGLTFLQSRPLKPVDPPRRQSFDDAQVRRGATLAAIGDCASCHTAPNGPAYAGGVALETPFGVIHGTNITPDPDTGIGRWSFAAFERAMREGTDQAGNRLYPAFPYNHFAKLTDDDLKALYAFVMTRQPVRAQTPENRLRFPYSIRGLVTFWNWLYLDDKPLKPDPRQSDEWSRGAYLVEALAHCGACHTPRTKWGGENSKARFDGGDAEGWWAPPLNGSTPALEPWDAERLTAYLRAWDDRHGGAVGPMAAVTANLAKAPDADVKAIAVYIASHFGQPDVGKKVRLEVLLSRPEPDLGDDAGLARGRDVFKGVCAQCHETGAQVPFTVQNLAQHTSLFAPTPDNVLRVALHGIRTPAGGFGPIMPGFAGSLKPQQLGDLARYLRARFTDLPPWPDPTAAARRLMNQPEGPAPAPAVAPKAWATAQ